MGNPRGRREPPVLAMTKAKGIWANFVSACFRCSEPVTVTNGRPDPHTCK